MTWNKEGNSPVFELEIADFDVKEIVYSIIDMFSIFLWDNKYKNPREDEQLNFMLDVLQSYLVFNYEEDK